MLSECYHFTLKLTLLNHEIILLKFLKGNIPCSVMIENKLFGYFEI